MAINRHSYVAFYPSDWLGGTARMTRMHKSVYFDVCCYVWDQNKPCPPAELPLMLGDLPDWRSYVDDLVAAGKLIRNEDGSLTNPKAAEEAEKAFLLWEKKSAGGKRGAAKTNTPGGTPDRTPAGTPGGSSPKTAGTPDAEPEPEPEPEPDKKEEESPTVRPRNPDESNGFERLEKEGLLTVTQSLARVGGVPLRPERPGAFNRELDQAKAWITDGIDIEKTAVPAIARQLARMTDTAGSLKVFDSAVRNAHAKTLTPDGEAKGPSQFDNAEAQRAYLAKLAG